MNASFWVEKLNLTPHPEGGYYRETYRCKEFISNSRNNSKRNTSTAIYFLLEGNQKSHFHKIQSDELWFFHKGSPIEILYIENGKLQILTLGNEMEKGNQLQAVIPAGIWFGARVKDQKGYSLVSCTVAPGFDFEDFEIGKKEKLKLEFPKLSDIIEEMSLE